MTIKILKDNKMMEDNLFRLLLSSGINLEYYDGVMWSGEYLNRFIETKKLDFEFYISGCSVTYKGVKTMILFLWVNYYDLETASQKMHEILSNLSEDELEAMSKHSLKQTLKRIRKTNINLS